MDLTRSNRTRIKQAFEKIKESARGRAEPSEAGGHSRSSDRIEISAEVRFLAAARAEDVDRATREPTTAELRATYLVGLLDTARRIESTTNSKTGYA